MRHKSQPARDIARKNQPYTKSLNSSVSFRSIWVFLVTHILGQVEGGRNSPENPLKLVAR